MWLRTIIALVRWPILDCRLSWLTISPLQFDFVKGTKDWKLLLSSSNVSNTNDTSSFFVHLLTATPWLAKYCSRVEATIHFPRLAKGAGWQAKHEASTSRSSIVIRLYFTLDLNPNLFSQILIHHSSTKSEKTWPADLSLKFIPEVTLTGFIFSLTGLRDANRLRRSCQLFKLQVQLCL